MADNKGHGRNHGLDDGDCHTGVSGATPDNLLSFDTNGLPKDSGYSSLSLPLFFDFRDTGKHVTGTANSGGGTVTGSINLGVSVGIAFVLRVTATGNTVDSDIEFFADAARTARCYFAEAKDCWSAPYTDGNPWACASLSLGMMELEGNELYYRITNNGANNSEYDIELFGLGSQPPVV